MSWRNPRYAFLHAGRDAGAAALTPSPAADADFPVDFLVDDRAGSLFKFGSSSSSAQVDLDRGAAGLEALDRLLIPSGHNLGGNTITLEADDNAGFSSPTTLLNAVAVSAGLIDQAFASNTERYLRLSIGGTGTWEIPEWVLTRTRTTTRGPEPGWEDYHEHNTLEFTKESGSIASLSLGPDRRVFAYRYRDVKDSDDLAVFSELIAAVGTARPFYLDPAFDTEAAIWVKLSEDSRQRQDPQVPAATDATQREIELRLREHVA